MLFNLALTANPLPFSQKFPISQVIFIKIKMESKINYKELQESKKNSFCFIGGFLTNKAHNMEGKCAQHLLQS